MMEKAFEVLNNVIIEKDLVVKQLKTTNSYLLFFVSLKNLYSKDEVENHSSFLRKKCKACLLLALYIKKKRA